MFEPESDFKDAQNFSDPFMAEEITNAITAHRAEQLRSEKKDQAERLALIRSQVHSFGEFFAFQEHLYSTFEAVRDAIYENAEDEPAAVLDTAGYSEREIANLRKRAVAMQVNARIHELTGVRPNKNNEKRAREGGDGEDDDDRPKITLSKRVEMEAGSRFNDNIDRTRSRLKEVNSTMSEIFVPTAEALCAGLAAIAKKWMIPWEWADGVLDATAPRKCRVIFFGASMGKTEVQQCTLFSTYSVATELAEKFEKAGLARAEMMAMTVVPLFHSSRWGEYNTVPTAVMRIFMAYARAAIFLLRPTHIITSTKAATELIQRGLNADARAPDEWMPNLMDSVRFGRGYKPMLLRLLHPMQVKNDEAGAQLRETKIEVLCKQLSPLKKLVNPFDRMMGRVTAEEAECGGLTWFMNSTVGISSFPTEEELASILRFNVAYIVNLTPRAVKGAAKSRWRGKEIKMDMDGSVAAIHTSIIDMLASISPTARIVIVCPTGIRSSVVFAAMIYATITAPFSSDVDVVAWAERARTVGVTQSDRSLIAAFHEYASCMHPVAVVNGDKPYAISMSEASGKTAYLSVAKSEAHARLAQSCLREVIRDRMHEKREMWQINYAPVSPEAIHSKTIQFMTKDVWKLISARISIDPDENLQEKFAKQKEEREKWNAKKQKKK